jgi:hypothetical protein
MSTSEQYTETGEDVEKIIERFPKLKYRPLVGRVELIEIARVMKQLPELQYPIASAGELIEKLGGSRGVFEIEGIKVSPRRMIKYMPAYYFPIFSVENFIEKVGELIIRNRKHVNIAEEVESIRKQLPRLHYPIRSAEQLAETLGQKTVYKFQNRDVSPERIVKRIPSDYFPIVSEDDFYRKIRRLMATRPLIAGD